MIQTYNPSHKKKMDNLLIEATSQTPKVELNLNGDLRISGVSTLSHAQKFYSEIVDWLNEYLKKNPSSLKLTLSMYYANTSSTLMLLDILRLVNTFKSNTTTVRIVWRYEEDDEDIFSFGEQLEIASNSRFEYEIIS
ncbi:hypothetical protein CNR22_04890 [Sphingobacteriaceae bacterium]|nr:hypothetical protein CNR22_04890 [Sphingobacteriaceae bacterium]